MHPMVIVVVSYLSMTTVVRFGCCLCQIDRVLHIQPDAQKQVFVGINNAVLREAQESSDEGDI